MVTCEGEKMISEELLISYLQEQKRQYQEQMIVLHRKVGNLSINNNEQQYIIVAMCDSIVNVIRIYTDLIERIKNREFDVEVANSLSTDTIHVNYGFNQAEKSIKPLNNIISSITDEEYNEDFINEMKNIEQEKSIPINCQQLEEEHEKNKKLKNHHKSLVDLTQQLHRSVMSKNRILTERLHEIDKLLNDLYEGIDEHYTETLENNDELAIACADAQLQLIKEIIDRVDKI